MVLDCGRAYPPTLDIILWKDCHHFQTVKHAKNIVSLRMRFALDEENERFREYAKLPLRLFAHYDGRIAVSVLISHEYCLSCYLNWSFHRRAARVMVSKLQLGNLIE